jgi:hypothetical protein
MVPINWIAIAIATVVAMIIGWLWYGPLFGKTWRSLTNNPAPKAAVIYPLTLVATFATAFVLAYVTGATSIALGNGYVVPAVFSALFLWLGFSFARALIVTLFEQKPVRLLLINTGHDLAVSLGIAAIIGLMGV